LQGRTYSRATPGDFDIAPEQVGAEINPVAGYAISLTASFAAPEYSRTSSPPIADGRRHG
jgi:hypothetical protein